MYLGAFFEETGIGIDWELSEQIWRLAGRAFHAYAERRPKQGDKCARRILADFIIGKSWAQGSIVASGLHLEQIAG